MSLIPEELPPGLYEQVVTHGLKRLLEQLSATHQIENADPGESHELLARHLHGVLRTVLHNVEGDDKEKLARQLALCNAILDAVRLQEPKAARLEEQIDAPTRTLFAVDSNGVDWHRPQRPVIPLHASALLVNEGERLSIGAALKRELESADSVDLICAFVNYTGVRILEPELRALCRRGPLRLITTTYMGATQRKALDRLHELGATIKITYELPPANTRLHAKAWLFRRNTGFHTAYIGSSNLSHSALMDGLEWNVRLSNVDASQVIARFQSAFERYWNDPAFEPYEPTRDRDRLDRALNTSDRVENDHLIEFFLDIQPRPHQKEILEALDVARKRHDRWRNLVVAATGTGKTIVAALDYKRLRQEWGDPTLLFVAHRKEILDQSRAAFQMVLRDHSFGERWVEGDRPVDYRHVFASIQSLERFDLSRLDPAHFDVVIVDEFHHAAARTYMALLNHVRPKVLLGLTATPERADGKNVMDFFREGSITEMRLWDALEQGLLCPFQYFGIADGIDLKDLRWEKGAYILDDLEEKYVTNGDYRAGLVFEQIRKIVTDWHKMRALGFCVSVKHARFMQRKFAQFGVPCAFVDAGTSAEERRRVVRELRQGTLNVVFVVDLFNEGIDIPEVDTVLFLRPTESATVFLQQLGRGLRLCENKPCLTVLDFIGQQHQKFRFEFRYRALTGLSRTGLQEQATSGFAALPAGCHIQLDRVSREIVLANLRNSLPLRTKQMEEELRQLSRSRAGLTLAEFLQETELQPEDLYRNGRSYTQLLRKVGLLPGSASPLESIMGKALGRILHIEDTERTGFYRDLLSTPRVPAMADLSRRQQQMLYMLAYGLLGDFQISTLQDAIQRLWGETAIRTELAALLALLDKRSDRLTYEINEPGMEETPIRLHGTYSQDEVMAAFGVPNPAAMREGVRYFKEHRCDTLFVTLRKSEQDYSPTTRYDDFVVSPTEFHWESQAGTTPKQPTGDRYIHHLEQSSHVLLFVRESKRQDGRTSPYFCLGPATYMQHESERPMRILWKLKHAMPTTVFQDYKAAAG